MLVGFDVLSLLVLDLAVMERRVRGVCHRERGGVRGMIDRNFGGNGGRALEQLDRWSRTHRHLLDVGEGGCVRWYRWLGRFARCRWLLLCLGSLQLSL